MSSTPNPTPAAPAKESAGTKIKTFFEHVGEWFKDHLGSAASFEQTAATAIAVAEPLLDTVVGLVAGSTVEAKAQSVINQVKTDLNDAAALLNGAESSGGITLTSALTAAKANLGTLLADADIKNSAKVSEITTAVNTVIGEIEAIQGAIPTGHTSAVVGGGTIASS